MSRTPAAWLALAWPVCLSLLLLGEFVLFDQVGAHHHTWVYPRWNDQIQYLTESYLGFENAKAHGLLVALRDALTNPSAQGTLHDFWAILVFKIAGATRSSALSLNMIAFLFWQIAVFGFTLRQTRSKSLALVAAMLLLAIKSPWEPGPGSAYDFRLDWMAACTMGLALVAAQWTNGFKERGASIVFGVSVALVLLTRFLTGTYFILIYAAFLASTLSSDRRWTRTGNLLISGAVAAVLAGPIMWISREYVYNYYFIGHFTGPESAIRSSHMGLLRSTDWLGENLSARHIGATFWWLWTFTVMASIAAWLLWPANPVERNFEFVPPRFPLYPAVCFLFAPAVVLILHLQKSELVLSIMLPGATTIAAGVIIRFLRASSRKAVVTIAAGVAITATGTFVFRMSRNPHSERFHAEARRVAHFADYIAKRSEHAGLDHPRIAVDRVTDSLDAQVMRVICYERQHRWFPFIMTLPTGIGAEPDPTIFFERIANSDFVFVTEEGTEGGWPYDRQLTSLRPRTLAWAQEHMKQVDEIAFSDFKMAFFERADLP